MENICRMLKTLPKMVSAKPLNFITPPPTPPLSPTHSSRKAQSIPVILVPQEARKKSVKENSDAKEPTSPKVSCLGDIKGFKRNNQKKIVHKSASSTSLVTEGEKKKKKKLSYRGKRSDEIKVDDNEEDNQSSVNYRSFRTNKEFGSDFGDVENTRAGRFGEITHFYSGRRGTLADFDWKAHEL